MNAELNMMNVFDSTDYSCNVMKNSLEHNQHYSCCNTKGSGAAVYIYANTYWFK